MKESTIRKYISDMNNSKLDPYKMVRIKLQDFTLNQIIDINN